MASCCVDVQGEGKAEVEDTQSSGILNKVNLHSHWFENLKSCKGDILPVHAMKAYGEVEKI